MRIHPVMKQVHIEWVIHKLHVILFSCLITKPQLPLRKKKKFNFSKIMQLYFAHKQLLKSPVMSPVDFFSWYSAPLNGLPKRDTG